MINTTNGLRLKAFIKGDYYEKSIKNNKYNSGDNPDSYNCCCYMVSGTSDANICTVQIRIQ